MLTKLNLMKLKKGSLIIEESREQEMQEMVPGENRSFDDEIPSEDDDDDVSESMNTQTGTMTRRSLYLSLIATPITHFSFVFVFFYALTFIFGGFFIVDILKCHLTL